ncbi:MAG: aldo/keto reductase [Clostridia bacterium]|nr:aldo/keto reductase [Clostridia bacterium]
MMKKMMIGPVDVSEFALGAGKRGPKEMDEACFAVMDRYLEYGGTTFDSARIYAAGQADEALGRWLRSRKIDRSSVRLVLKGCHPTDTKQMHISRLSPEEIRFDLEESLRAVGTEYADLYLLHRDNPRLPVDEIMIELDKLVREGKARAVGCSNWTIGRIIEANEFAEANGLTPLSTCQIHFSLALTTAAQSKDVTHVPMNDIEFGWYEESGFPIMGFGPQGRGFFHRKLNGLPVSENDMRYYERIPENRRRADRLGRLAKESGYSPASLLLAYSRDNRINSEPLAGFSSIAQMDDAYGALNFTLSPEQIRFLESGEGEI